MLRIHLTDIQRSELQALRRTDLPAASRDRLEMVFLSDAGWSPPKIAEHLSRHPAVAWVSYPGLEADRYHQLHKRYCPHGAGAVFTFGLKGGYEAGVALVSNLKLFSHLANIGDTRSLVIHPASTTHRQLTDEQKTRAGAGPEVVRLSVGIEDPRDLIADLDQALA